VPAEVHIQHTTEVVKTRNHPAENVMDTRQKSMNVLFLSTCYPHRSAPVRGTYNYELCGAMQNFARMRVVSPRPWPEVVCNWRRSPLTAANPEAIQTVWPTYLYPPKVMRHRYGQFMWRSIQKQVARTTADFDTNWVLSYWAHPDGEAGIQAARSVGAKSAVVIGGSDVLLITREVRRRKCVQRVLCDSDAIFTVSEGLRQKVIELGIEPEKIYTVRQGINPEIFSSGLKSEARKRLKLAVDARIFLWVGRMVSVKQPSLLLEAFAQVRRAEPAAILVCAGAGPLLEEMRRTVEQAGLCDAVLFQGAIPQSELPDWYRAANATVLSSQSEGLPNVLRESLACGTPFVSTNVGSISEIAAPEYSLLTRPNDAAELSGAMLEVLNDRYQAEARAFTPRCWSDCAEEMIDIMSTFREEPLPNGDAPVSSGAVDGKSGETVRIATLSPATGKQRA